MKLDILDRFMKNPQILNLMKIHTDISCGQTDRQKDRHDEVNNCFWKFLRGHQKKILKLYLLIKIIN